MTTSSSFVDAPEGTREELMRATYLALCEHGYASLTIQRIADEFSKSKSLIYHHYDGKDELLLDFLEFMLDRFEGRVPSAADDDALTQLQAIFDHVFTTPLPAEREQFSRAMIELRAQAAHDEGYRDHFTRHDRFFIDRLADIIETGVEEGTFRAVDPEATATLLVTTMNGALSQRVTSDDDTAETVREQLDSFISTIRKEDDA